MSIKFISILFLCAFICANLLVKHFGAYGLWFSSALLIPFDFVCRCIIHERLKGAKLINTLFVLILLAAAFTVLINFDAKRIAGASIVGFMFAQVGAGIFYQAKKAKSSFFVKVNVSDLIAITLDSIAFQMVAFSTFNPGITLGQIAIKFLGGLFWYLIIFKWLKFHKIVMTPEELNEESWKHFPEDTELHFEKRRVWKERYINNQNK